MDWLRRWLCALGWRQWCPREADPELAALRADLARTVIHHGLDDDREFDAHLAALDTEIRLARDARGVRERRQRAE